VSAVVELIQLCKVPLKHFWCDSVTLISAWFIIIITIIIQIRSDATGSNVAY